MKIPIFPFNKWSCKKLQYFNKTCTSRNKKYGNVGDTFEVVLLNGNTNHYKLTHVERVTLGFVRDHFYEKEGCDNPKHFEKIWVEIHPGKKFDQNHKVWLHCFKFMKSVK